MVKKRKVGRPPEGGRGQRVRDFPQLCMRVRPSVARAFNALCRKLGVTKGALLERLMK